MRARKKFQDKQNVAYLYNGMFISRKKRNEILIPATTWINLENIMLNERSQTSKAMYCMTQFM